MKKVKKMALNYENQGKKEVVSDVILPSWAANVDDFIRQVGKTMIATIDRESLLKYSDFVTYRQTRSGLRTN